jgi:hypothetical protein
MPFYNLGKIDLMISASAPSSSLSLSSFCRLGSMPNDSSSFCQYSFYLDVLFFFGYRCHINVVVIFLQHGNLTRIEKIAGRKIRLTVS